MDPMVNSSFRLFSIGRTPVYIHQTFVFLVVLVFALNYDQPIAATSRIVALFLAVLVHELGHVLAASRFGLRSDVVLWAMGGLTIPDGTVSGWRNVVLSVAGPLAGFAFWAVLWFGFMPEEAAALGWKTRWDSIWHPFDFAVAIHRGYFPIQETGWHRLWQSLCFYNLYWGIANLLPIMPLDGGQALREVLTWFKRRIEAEKLSAWIGIVTGLGVAFLCWRTQQPTLTILLFLGLVYWNFNRLQTES